MVSKSFKNLFCNKRFARQAVFLAIASTYSICASSSSAVFAQQGGRGFDPIQYMDPAPKPAVQPQNDSGQDSSSPGGNFYQGSVSAEGSKAPLQATIKHTDLQGDAEDGGGELSPGRGQMDRYNKLLDGQAQQLDSGLQSQDPDMADQELQVEWDKWRNRFLWSVQSGVQQMLNSHEDPAMRFDPRSGQYLMKFPMGTVAWFSCTVTKDRRILDAKITQPSGFPGYDRAVLNAVMMLDQTSILKFPSRSQRARVYQDAGIKTAESGQRQYFKFGDVERYSVPGQ
ncbi:MAG: energy transducer TonB [Candidatus Melainabacteria bacterium]|nr:energy transducer TonB [Candidatus Melainabacteria bacterium]